MVRRRHHGWRRHQRTSSSSSAAASLAIAVLAVYLISLSSTSTSAASAAAAAAASAARPAGDAPQPQKGGGIGGKGQQGPVVSGSGGASAARPAGDAPQPQKGGGIGGKGQQGPVVSGSWVESLEERLGGDSEGGVKEVGGRAEEGAPVYSGGGGSGSSGDGNGGGFSILQPGHPPVDVERGSRDASVAAADGGSATREAVLAPAGVERDGIAGLSARSVQDSVSGDGAFSRGVGGSKGGDGAGSNDRWAAQTVGVPAPPVGDPSYRRSTAAPKGPPPRASLDAVKTIGGTLPNILGDSAWYAGGEDCVAPPPAEGALAGTGAGGGDDKSEDNSTEQERIAEGVASAAGAGRAANAGACPSTVTSSTDSRKRSRVNGDDGFRGGTVYPYSGQASAAPKQPPPQRRQGLFPTEAAPSAPPAVAAAEESRQGRRGPLVKGEGANTNTDNSRPRRDAGLYGGALSDPRGAAAPAAPAQDRGKITTVAGREDGAGDGARQWPRQGDASGAGVDAGAAAEVGGSCPKMSAAAGETQEDVKETEQNQEAVAGVTAVGERHSSWSTFACTLLLGAMLLGTYLRGTLLRWVPFLGRDPREGWALDLDSAIATARSRASSFCSGGRPSGVFPADALGDSDLPELVSDHEGEDGDGEGDDDDDDGESGGGSGDGRGGEPPLMWDTRPKPDDYLVFHPILGVVPAGAVRAWGGEGRGGWSGGSSSSRAGRKGRAAAAAAALNGGCGGEGGTDPLKDSPCCSSTRLKKPRPREDTAGGEGEGEVSEADGDGSRKRLPPLRNTDEWFEWVAAREAAAATAAAATAAATVPDGRKAGESSAAVGPVEAGKALVLAPETGAETGTGAGAAAAATVPEEGATAAVVVPAAGTTTASTGVPAEDSAEGGEAADTGSGSEPPERGDGDDSKTTSATEMATTKAATITTTRTAATMATVPETVVVAVTSVPPGSSSHTPAALGLQFGAGTGGRADGGTGGGGGGGGNSSNGGDDRLGFGGGGGGGGGGVCSSEEGGRGRGDVVLGDDFSAPRRLSSEQPPAVPAAYRVS